jgi:hypothetical protein
VKGVKSILGDRRRWIDGWINIGLLRLELLALGTVHCEAGWHWRSDFRNLLHWWLKWCRLRLERLECTVALLNVLRLLLLRKTIGLEVKFGFRRVKIRSRLGKNLRYEGNILHCRLNSEIVDWELEIRDLNLRKCSVVAITVEIWRGQTVDRVAKHGHLKRLIVFLLGKLLSHKLGFSLTDVIGGQDKVSLYCRFNGHLWFRHKVWI